jgi:arginase
MTGAALLRVPRAWGEGGAAMCEAAAMDVGLPEAASVAMSSLEEQTDAVAAALPELPVVLGGCCCAHVGAAAGLARRHGRIAVIWFDAHGDLNTPGTSPSGNAWGMPFRMILDDGHAAAGDCALLGARNLDPPEADFIAATGLATSEASLGSVVAGTVGAYIAFDCDVLDPAEIDCFMPEPDGPSLDDCARIVGSVAGLAPVLGIGFTGLVSSADNPARLRRIAAAALPEPAGGG